MQPDETAAAAALPPTSRMLEAFLSSDGDYDGVFVTGVKTTGIFCRPSCPARKPRARNVEFFASTRDAVQAGYRPCKRCRPMENPASAPKWIGRLLADVHADPGRRWRDEDLRARGIEPERARRWFKRHHGMTFHAYARGLRLSGALGAISKGNSVTHAGMDHGFESISGFADAVRRATGRSPSAADNLIRFERLDTPLGPMIAGASEAGLSLLEFADRRALEGQLRTLAGKLSATLVPGSHPVIDAARAQLDEYFAARRREFDLPLVIRGTDFQETVWRALLSIPYGRTWSYAELARTIDNPGAVRAVGTANGANRLAIVIPCHRVIGADGKLSGYGGGVWRKRRLLELEAGRPIRS